MNKLLILLTGLSLVTAAPAAAQQNCYMNTVRNSTGATLALSNGFIFMVYPGQDRVTVGLWNPLDKVQVCRGGGSKSNITNLSQAKPTTIAALRQ